MWCQQKQKRANWTNRQTDGGQSDTLVRGTCFTGATKMVLLQYSSQNNGSIDMRLFNFANSHAYWTRIMISVDIITAPTLLSSSRILPDSHAYWTIILIQSVDIITPHLVVVLHNPPRILHALFETASQVQHFLCQLLVLLTLVLNQSVDVSVLVRFSLPQAWLLLWNNNQL